MSYLHYRVRAFSLVELSIVLVILGLLVGGVLSGQSLIRAAELRSVTEDFSKYMAATRTFKDKYFALPGDMTNATSFWGILAGTGSDVTCQNTLAIAAPTCNGNGDGQILTSVVNLDEASRFWQHLANAGLIEGQFNGVQGAGSVIGANVPASKITSAFWYVSYTGVQAGSAVTYFPIDYGNRLSFKSNGSTSTAGSYPLKPEEAWNIDTKIDDGKPSTGMVIAEKGDGTNTFCTSEAGVNPGDSSAIYTLTDANKDCYLFFVRLF